MRLGLAVPLYDEADCCEAVVRGLVSTLASAGIPTTLALVNNGSTDGTGAIIDRLARTLPGCQALHLTANAGYGGGILAGLASLATPILGWFWGDGQIGPDAVVAAYRLLTDEGLDLAKARRVRRHDGLQRAAISRVYNTVMRLGFGLPSDDCNGCPKLLTRAALDRVAPRSRDWFLDPEVMLRAAELGLRWGEVDAVMQARAGGSSKVRWSTSVEFARRLLAWRRGVRG